LLEVVFEKGQVTIYQRKVRKPTTTGEEWKVLDNKELKVHQDEMKKDKNADEKEIFEVKFEKERNVPTFSQMLCDLSQKNTTFSPDFSHML
jgi:hypothetical protein